MSEAPEKKELSDHVRVTNPYPTRDVQSFSRRLILGLSFFGVLGLTVGWTDPFRSSPESTDLTTLETTELNSDSLTESRSSYTFEVAKTARARETVVTDDLPQPVRAILAPATLSILLGAIGILGLLSADLRQCNRALDQSTHHQPPT